MTEETWVAIASGAGALLINVVLLAVWGGRLDSKVDSMEKRLEDTDKRIIDIDNGGTRGMLVLAERQQSLTNSIERLETRVDQNAHTIEKKLGEVSKEFNDTIREVFEFLRKLKVSIDRNGHHP